MRRSPFNTVTFRLTAWHLLLFTLVSAAIMGLAEARLDAILRARTDHDLQEDLIELRADFAAAGLRKLQEAFDREAKSNGPEVIVLALVSAAGEIRASSDLAPWAPLAHLGVLLVGHQLKPVVERPDRRQQIMAQARAQQAG